MKRNIDLSPNKKEHHEKKDDEEKQSRAVDAMKCKDLCKFILFCFCQCHFVLPPKMIFFFFWQREHAYDAKKQDQANNAKGLEVQAGNEEKHKQAVNEE